MRESHINAGEKVLVLGAGQLGAAVLSSLIPAVKRQNGTVAVIVSPGSWGDRGSCFLLAINNWRRRGQNLLPAT